MSKRLKQENFTPSLMIHYVDGMLMEKYKVFAQKVSTEDTLLAQIQINKILSMLESLQENNKKIFRGKSITFQKNIQNTLSSKILDLDLILKGKGLIPFWTSSIKKKSTKLWLPQETDLHASDLNSFKRCFLDSVPNSQVFLPQNVKNLKKNSLKISFRLSQSSPLDTMVEENIVTRKIRIYPSAEQKKFFNKCFGVTRFVYNKIVNIVNLKYKELQRKKDQGCIFTNDQGQCCKEINTKSNYFCKTHIKKKVDYGYNLNLMSLRKVSGIFSREFLEENKWLEEVPYDTRQLVINDFMGAYKAAMTNFKRSNIKGFELKYKSKKNPTQIFHINKRALNTWKKKILTKIKKKSKKSSKKKTKRETEENLIIFKRKKLGKIRLRKKMKKWYNKNIKDIKHNCKIIRYGSGEYYLLLSINNKDKKYEKKALFNIVSLDPGVRTFQTFYSPDGLVGKLGDNLVDKLMKYGKKIDTLDQVKSGNIKNKTKRNICKRQFKLRTKIKNIVNDMHWKTANFLCKNFETIIIPRFEVNQMTHRQRSISSKVTRKMLSLSHGKFREILKHKSKMYRRNLIFVTEEYTSKTCTKCGNLKNDLGGNKVYKCNKCGLTIDRDYNGARNILLKTISFK